MKIFKFLFLVVACNLLITNSVVRAANDTIPAGTDSISAYLENALVGDTLYLINGEKYIETNPILIDKAITLMAQTIPSLPALANMPRIANDSGVVNLIQLTTGAMLTLIGIDIDGGDTANTCISLGDSLAVVEGLAINRCRIHNVKKDLISCSKKYSVIFKAFECKNTFAYNSGQHGLYVKDVFAGEDDNSPYVFEDITFWNLGQQLVWIQAFDRADNSMKQTYLLDHMTGWKLGTLRDRELMGNSDAGGQYTIHLSNSIFSDQAMPSNSASLAFTTANDNGSPNLFKLKNLVLHNVNPKQDRGDSHPTPIPLTNLYTADPQFTDTTNRDFTIGNADYLGAADRGEVIGARYWHPDYVDNFTDFQPAEKNNSLLDTILVNGKLINGFNQDVLNYLYIVEPGVSIPEIAYSLLIGNASVEKNDAINLTGTKEERTTTLTVTSENGFFETVYSIEFYILRDDSTLSDLTVDGNTIDNFSSEIFTYNFTLPAGTTKVPSVNGVKNHEMSTMKIVPATNLFGTKEERTTQIIVTAENNIAVGTYSVEFYVISSDSALSDLTIDATTIDGFNSDSLAYAYGVAFGTTQIPTINAVVASDSAKVEIIPAKNLYGTKAERTAQIIVTAEDELSKNTYTIEFYIMSNNSALTDLTVDGSTIEGFSSNTFTYIYKVASGTVQVPSISGVVSYDSAKLEIIPAQKLNGTKEERTAQIIVSAEDDTYESTYSVEFYKMSADATLSDLLVNGTSIANFNPKALTYTYRVDVTDPIPVVSGVSTNDSASIEVVPAININGSEAQRTTIVTVTAEDENYSKVYSVLFTLSTSTKERSYIVEHLVSPTLVKHKLTINHFEQVNQVVIVSLSGKCVSIDKAKLNRGQIDVSYLSAGVYIIKASSKSGIYTDRFIKE